MTHGSGTETQRTATPPIVPRWEWRTFGEHFGDADNRFAGLSPGRVEEGDEIYLLSLASDASCKVRAGLMDVKRLERRNDDGLELWKPVMKASFPLSAQDAAGVITALDATVLDCRAASTPPRSSSPRWWGRATA